MHYRVIVDEYAKVELLTVNPNHLEYEIDIPTPRKKILGNLIGNSYYGNSEILC